MKKLKTCFQKIINRIIRLELLNKAVTKICASIKKVSENEYWTIPSQSKFKTILYIIITEYYKSYKKSETEN